MSADLYADTFEQTERRLGQWGYECRRMSRELGLPTISNFGQLVSQIRRREDALVAREHTKARKKKLRNKIRDHRRAKKPVDSKDVAQSSGFAELDVTAQGKSTLSRQPQGFGLSAGAAEVNAAVRSLPNWMQVPLFRTYLYLEPHRVAAWDLQMPESDYRSHWKAAVEEVAVRLANRKSGVVR